MGENGLTSDSTELERYISNLKGAAIAVWIGLAAIFLGLFSIEPSFTFEKVGALIFIFVMITVGQMMFYDGGKQRLIAKYGKTDTNEKDEMQQIE
jgi:amino acid transporter